jgi:RNA ligase partner protein
MTEEIRRKYVLDTSVFMSVDIRDDDQSMVEAIDELMDMIEEASRNGTEFYMPSTTYAEFREIMEGKASDELLQRIDTWINRKGASRHEEELPANTVYQFVEEMRKRIDRGLRISEEAVREVQHTEEPDKEHYSREDKVVSDLRDKYRESMRKGVPDSGEDLDLLILARELDATLVTEDNGILEWSEEFGVQHMKGRRLPGVLEQL